MKLPITNFARGEFAPELYGRVDLPQYAAGAKRLRNFIVQRYGGVTTRPGFRFVYRLDEETQHKLVPFNYSTTQGYMLVLDDESMRVATGGGVIVEEDLEILSITKGVTTTFEIPYHDMSVGQEVFLTGNTGIPELNDRVVMITAIPDANHITVDLDSTNFGTLTASTGIERTAAPTPPPAPEPPPPPPPAPEPPPPTGGGGGVDPGGFCVEISTPILMADGTEKAAGDLQVGDVVRTVHEHTMEWGDYPVEAITIVEQDVLEHPAIPFRATAEHRIWALGGFMTVEMFGAQPAGKAKVAKITVTDAHTYISAGLLSHNVKNDPYGV